MKKYKIILLISFSLIITACLFAKDYTKMFYRGTFLSQKEAEKKWGTKELDINSWKNGTIQDRAAMTASLLKNKKKYIRKPNTEIVTLFGKPDSYYISDLIPAYVVQEYKKEGDEGWELVFLIDRNDKIIDIKAHRQYPK